MSGFAILLAEPTGWVKKPGLKKQKRSITKPRYRTPDDAEKDRKFRTGVVVRKGRL